MAEEYLFEVGRLCATRRHCLGLMNTVSSVTKVDNLILRDGTSKRVGSQDSQCSFFLWFNICSSLLRTNPESAVVEVRFPPTKNSGREVVVMAAVMISLAMLSRGERHRGEIRRVEMGASFG